MRALTALLLAGLLLARDEDWSRYKPPRNAKTATVEAPRPRSTKRPYFGITGGRPAETGVIIDGLDPEGPAYKAGLREGDTLLKFQNKEVPNYDDLSRLIRAEKAGAEVKVVYQREGKESELTFRLGERESQGGTFKGSVFTLAVILVEFADVKHNPDFAPEDFDKMLFSVDTYFGKNKFGDRVYGSMNDFYIENSYGKFRIEGKSYGWILLPSTRESIEGGKTFRKDFLGKTIELVNAKYGEGVLDQYDGLTIIYAGIQSHLRGRSPLWPHRSSVRVGKKSLAYMLCAEGGKWFNPINVHTHEFGHGIGLPDQYGRRHRTGVGKWCTMAVGHMGSGESNSDRPHHLCAWCKIRLGWVTPAVIDPNEPQWLRLDPIAKDPTQCFKVILNAQGTEYYLLENRQRIGFDSDLEGTGLLVWHCTDGGRVDLIEAHGKKVENASLVDTEEIPYPSFFNEHLTPDTAPASKGGVYITDIVERGGTVYFKIGIEKKAQTRTLEKTKEY